MSESFSDIVETRVGAIGQEQARRIADAVEALVREMTSLGLEDDDDGSFRKAAAAAKADLVMTLAGLPSVCGGSKG